MRDILEKRFTLFLKFNKFAEGDINVNVSYIYYDTLLKVYTKFELTKIFSADETFNDWAIPRRGCACSVDKWKFP